MSFVLESLPGSRFCIHWSRRLKLRKPDRSIFTISQYLGIAAGEQIARGRPEIYQQGNIGLHFRVGWRTMSNPPAREQIKSVPCPSPPDRVHSELIGELDQVRDIRKTRDS